MSNIDGENADFDEFHLPAANTNPPDETLEFEAAGQLLEPVDDLLQPAEESPGSEMLQPEEGALFAGVGLAGAGEVEAEEESEERPPDKKKKKPGFLAKLTTTSPYVVLLGISVVAILIGILCLLLELGRYEGQIKPTQTGMRPAVQSGPPSTTAAA